MADKRRHSVPLDTSPLEGEGLPRTGSGVASRREGRGGRGVATPSAASRYPPPQPSPSRGEGAGPVADQRQANSDHLSPLGREPAPDSIRARPSEARSGEGD